MTGQSFPIESLRRWFEESKRDLPWRQAASPYAVWVSEVMLQQTQVGVVIPYFERWMNRFPTINDLAEADIDEVIKMWEGLGYYSRARQLHAGAREVVETWGGTLPKTGEELGKIPGIGPYTLGAILSFAFKQKAAAVDGNVARVLCRFFCFEENIDKPATMRRLREVTEAILPEREPWVVMEGLIELGAMVCSREPKCTSCPLKGSCLAFQTGKERLLPTRMARPKTTELIRHVAVVIAEGHVLVKREKKGRVMAGLYEFPYFQDKAMRKQLEGLLSTSVEKKGELSVVNHSFTRFRATLYPSIWKSEKRKEVAGYEWVSKEKLSSLPFSSGHRRVLKEVADANFAH
jgi:A/G-specific adenine glycosylase